MTQGTTVGSFIASLKDAGVSANFDATNHRIFVSSKETGKDNDFTLTGGNADGISALTKLGLNVKSDATDATYTSYTQYYDADGNKLNQNITDAIAAYKAAQEGLQDEDGTECQSDRILWLCQRLFGNDGCLKGSGLSDADQKKLQTLLGMTASQRVDSLMDANGNVYTKSDTDSLGNTIYSYKDENGDTSYIRRMVTYEDGSNVYTKNEGWYLYGRRWACVESDW